MIVFESVEWKNFLSTGNSANKVLLNKSSTTLIIGKNGEGKSTILDALCFGLFGKPFRNINKGQLVNSINNKNCLVTINFNISSKSYKIVRGIKPNVFEIWCDGILMNQDAASRDYQKVLEQQILRLNFKTFTQVVILGSASFVPFMQLPSGQRREVIEDILDIRIFSVMNQILKEKVSETKSQIERITQEIDVAKAKVDGQQVLIKTLSDAKSEAIGSLLSKIENNNSEILRSETEVATTLAEITALQSRTEKKSKIDSDLEKAKGFKTKLVSIIEQHESHAEFFNENDVCPSCTQGIPHTHKETILKQLNDNIEFENKRISDLEGIFTKLNTEITEVNNLLKEITDKNITVSTYNANIAMLTKMNKNLQQEIDDHKADNTNVDEEKRKLKELAQEAISKINVKTTLAEERNLQEIASTLLKDTGIKTAIIREYLPVMNKLINKYLTAMDAYIHFDLDESFNEIVKSRHRDDFTYASFSEGEKMRIDLAILFTWRHIAKMKNSVNTNLLLLDEIFDSSLDTAGTDYFLNLMDQLGDKSNIFVISHKGDQLFDKFRSVIKFEKRNDFSVIAAP
jgi:DNA repair exonuclease SbcCD ATPase subunit